VTRLVRAPNPGPMTLEGTNTWLVGRRRVLVVDPGPADDGHLAAVLAEVGRDGGALGGVLLTHRHQDHSDALGAPVLQEALRASGAAVLALDPSFGSPPDEAALAAVSDEPVQVLPLPGHTDDSLALVLPGPRQVCTGDTVLGRGTSVVAYPDGDLTRYLASLERLLALAPAGRGWSGLPGHGPVLDDLAGAVARLLSHRLARVEQVRAALAALNDRAPLGDRDGDHVLSDRDGDDTLVDIVVAAVYPDLAEEVLRRAAGRTVRATLVHLGRDL